MIEHHPRALGSLLVWMTLATSLARAETIVFEAADGRTVQAEAGSFEVPENRAHADRRTLTLHYVRFPSTSETPAAPIVYLAGGPGGSGIHTARGRRFELFMRLREVADVIAFDQRDTGRSDSIPTCQSKAGVARNEAATRDRLIEEFRLAAEECATFWRTKGIDISGYDTVQSAHDLNDLRVHLGAEQISLWGISYGTHLALAALKVMEPHIDRVVLASVEGLDQTVKLPSATMQYFARLQALIDDEPAAHALYPDVVDLVGDLVARLTAHPAEVDLGEDHGGIVVLSAYDVQLLTGAMISDPTRIASLLPLLSKASAGDLVPLARTVTRFIRPYYDPIAFSGMAELMDVASGISEARLARVRREAESSVLGDALNFPMPTLTGAFGDIDLGEDFRRAPRSARPVLVLSGTLDGRTYPRAHRSATRGLTDATYVTINNAGHNLLMASPEVGDLILAFMRAETVPTTTIDVPRPSFSP